MRKLLILAFVMGTFSFNSLYADDFEHAAFIPTEPEPLLEAYTQEYGEKFIFSGIREYLGCIVNNLDLPPEVYVGCGVSLVKTVLMCRQGFDMNCANGVAETGRICAEPMNSVVDAITLCNDDTE